MCIPATYQRREIAGNGQSFARADNEAQAGEEELSCQSNVRHTTLVGALKDLGSLVLASHLKAVQPGSARPSQNMVRWTYSVRDPT